MQECQWICVGECQLRIQDLAKWKGGGGGGGAVLREVRHIDNECLWSQGWIRKAGGGGGGGGGGCCPF